MIQQQLNCILNKLPLLVGDKIFLHLSLNPFYQQVMGDTKLTNGSILMFGIHWTMLQKLGNFSRFHIEL